jgi:cytochrome P450 / NADPH-cytochrome P450 reductase
MQVPKDVDGMMQKAGAERLGPATFSDAAVSDIFSDFEGWLQDQLWSSLARKYNIDTGVVDTNSTIDLIRGQPLRVAMRRGFMATTVTESRLLSAPGVAAKRHLGLKFPDDTVYRVGDRVQILPRNRPETVKRVLLLFGLDEDELLTISSARNLGIPTETPVTAAELLGAYFELTQAATVKNIQILADKASDVTTSSALRKLASSSNFESNIRHNHVSVLDLLERFRTVDLPLSSFISMLPQMRPRAYSLSSAPAQRPGEGTLTYTVVGSEQSERNSTLGHRSEGVLGVASNYLASLEPGNTLYVSLFPTQREFQLPQPTTHIIMISTGAGLAPFRGFVQERAGLRAAGHKLAPALLFFGCRGEKLDDIYRDELDQLERAGVVTVRRAYSRQPGAKCKYVQDSIAKFRGDVSKLWQEGAVVYICSGKKVSDAVFEVLAPVLHEADQRSGKVGLDIDIEAWTKQLPRERYVMEIFN